MATAPLPEASVSQTEQSNIQNEVTNTTVPTKRKASENGNSHNSNPAKNKNTDIHLTVRNSPYTYFHLELTPSSLPPLDTITTSTHLHTPLAQFLGLSGSAIASQIDILKVTERQAWVRVPAADAAAVRAALTNWVGGAQGGVAWRVRGSGAWLGGLVGTVEGDGGKELFDA